MVTSTQTDYLQNKYGDFKTVDMLVEAGYGAIDYSIFSLPTDNPLSFQKSEDMKSALEYAKRLRDYAESKGIFCSQTHATFPQHYYYEDNAKLILPITLREIEISAALGAKTVVVHAVNYLPYAENKDKLFELNLNYYGALKECALENNVTICIENLFQRHKHSHNPIVGACSNPYEQCALIDELGEGFAACLDTGHSAITGNDPENHVLILGKRLKALHLQDTDYFEDKHQLPGTMKHNWTAIAKSLAEIGYDGDITLEADNFFSYFKPEFDRVCAKAMCSSAQKIADDVEFFKKNKV